ncbi:hypothetical protein GJ496_001710 [Pomphorhynchus laevis]|nr:hypothetical protein GJ496_001710 [Pomphorhynchus laevis]
MISTTRKGLPCIDWNMVISGDDFDSSKPLVVRPFKEFHNYCRKRWLPFPYCYFNSKEWDICNISICVNKDIRPFKSVMALVCDSQNDQCAKVLIDSHCDAVKKICVCPVEFPIITRSFAHINKFQCIVNKIFRKCYSDNENCIFKYGSIKNQTQFSLVCSKISDKCFCGNTVKNNVVTLKRPAYGRHTPMDVCVRYGNDFDVPEHSFNLANLNEDCTYKNCGAGLICVNYICACETINPAYSIVPHESQKSSVCREEHFGFMQPCISDWDCKKYFKCTNFTYLNGEHRRLCRCAEGSTFFSVFKNQDICIPCINKHYDNAEVTDDRECSCSSTEKTWDGHHCRYKSSFHERCSALLPCRLDLGLVCTDIDESDELLNSRCECESATLWNGYKCDSCEADEIIFKDWCVSEIRTSHSWYDAERICLDKAVNSSLLTFTGADDLLNFVQVIGEIRQTRHPRMFDYLQYFIGYRALDYSSDRCKGPDHISKRMA